MDSHTANKRVADNVDPVKEILATGKRDYIVVEIQALTAWHCTSQKANQFTNLRLAQTPVDRSPAHGRYGRAVAYRKRSRRSGIRDWSIAKLF